MSRKMVIAAVATAGLVGLGSAATAADLGLSTDQVKGAVTGNTKLDDFTKNNLNGQELKLPPTQSGDLAGMVSQLRGNLPEGGLLVEEGKVRGGTEGLAGSTESLARSLKQQNQQLPGGKAKTVKRLTASLDRAAGSIRQAPAERVHDSVDPNAELSRGLLGLEKSLQRMQQLDKQDVLNTGNGDILENKVTQTRISDLAKAVKLASVR